MGKMQKKKETKNEKKIPGLSCFGSGYKQPRFSQDLRRMQVLGGV
jgi:hypothetical protein